MIKYHGTPITPNDVFDKSMLGKNCLIPFPNPANLKRAIKICDKVIVDNGAFTLWRKGGVIDWDKYYKWLDNFKENIEFYFIPDVIDGTEQENDELIEDYFMRKQTKGVPIWHINESIERLKRLAEKFDYLAFGSAGEYAELGTDEWHEKMNEAMIEICDKDGKPKIKIHMLRCLNPVIFTRYPFFSGDSTNLAQNHSKYNSSKGTNDGWKILINRIEKYNSPEKYKFRKFYKQNSLF